MRLTSSIWRAAAACLLTLSTSCGEFLPEEPEEPAAQCDPARDAGCVCEDSITQTECVRGGNNCVCAVPGAGGNDDPNNDPGEVDPYETTVELELEPTSVTLEVDRDEAKGYLCLKDRIEPRAGIELTRSRCGDSNVIIGFTVLRSDPSVVYIGKSGVFEPTSTTGAEQGEGPYPGTTALRMPINGDASFVMRSVVLGQDRYDLSFDLNSKNDSGNYVITIPEATATKL